MSEQTSNIGDESQSFQSNAPIEMPFEGIKTELHTMVDNLQLDEPSGRRPLWQRVLIWQIPIWLVVFLVVLSYNPRVDSCGGVKINYKTKTLCIANDNDFFLFVEHFTCDFIEKGTIINDSIKMDSVASQVFDSYYSKHNIFIKDLTTEMEIRASMRNARYDTTSFCHNVALAYWNAGVRLLNEGKTDSACVYFNKLEQWKGADSVLTAEDREMMKRTCFPDLGNVKKAVIPPKSEPKPKERVPKQQEPIGKQPNTPEVNLKAPTVTPSVTFEKSSDLQQIIVPINDNSDGLSLTIHVFDKINRKPINGSTIEIRSEDGKTLYATEILKGNLMTWNGIEFGKKYMAVAFKETYEQDLAIISIDERSSAKTKFSYSDSLYLTPFSGMPLIVYFDNDNPDPRSQNTTTSYSYAETYVTYYAKQTEYLAAFYKDNNDVSKSGANEITDFFQNNIRLGYDKLNEFSYRLLTYLTNGYGMEILLEGYTAPLGDASYNRNLSSREISSVINHFEKYQNGIFRSYISNGQLQLTVRPYGEEKADKAVSDDDKNRRKSVYSIAAMRERRVEIKEINVFQYNPSSKK